MRLRPSQPPRRGIVLLAVLLVVVILSLAAYKYNDWMLAEHRAAEMSVRAGQSRAFAESGVHYAAALLAGDVSQTLSGNPWDNPGMFQGIAVPSADPNARTGRFSLVSLTVPDANGSGASGYRFGVTDEAGKINLNALLALDRSTQRGGGGGGGGGSGAQATPTTGSTSTSSSTSSSPSKLILMGLEPLGMTDEIANSILNWMDPNGTIRSPGADSSYYSTLNPPYRPKNGPLDSLEELLLVKGVTPELLFGNDRNRNGVLDPDEDDGTGQVNHGWSAYLTVYSREANVDSQGAQRINVNCSQEELSTVYDRLVQAVGQQLADYIVAFRMYGGTSTTGSGRGTRNPRGGVGGMSRTDSSAVTTQIRTARTGGGGSGGRGGSGGQGQQQLRRINSLWDLVNSQVSVPTGSGNQQQNVTLPSPLNDANQQEQLLPTLLDKCSTSASLDLPPRINLNTAPQAVLVAIKDYARLTDGDVQTILGQRPDPNAAAPDPVFKSLTWMYTRANLSLDKIKRLEPILTARSQVYRVQSVGYFDQGGPASRVEAIIDVNLGRPRIIYWRDLGAELGRGFAFTGTGNN